MRDASRDSRKKKPIGSCPGSRDETASPDGFGAVGLATPAAPPCMSSASRHHDRKDESQMFIAGSDPFLKSDRPGSKRIHWYHLATIPNASRLTWLGCLSVCRATSKIHTRSAFDPDFGRQLALGVQRRAETVFGN